MAAQSDQDSRRELSFRPSEIQFRQSGAIQPSRILYAHASILMGSFLPQEMVVSPQFVK